MPVKFSRLFIVRKIIWDEEATIPFVLDVEKDLQVELLRSRGEEYYFHAGSCKEVRQMLYDEGVTDMYESCDEEIIDESLCDEDNIIYK